MLKSTNFSFSFLFLGRSTTGKQHCCKESYTHARNGQLARAPAGCNGKKASHMHSCRPFGVYKESHWLPHHAGTILPDRSMIASQWGQRVPVTPVDRLPAYWQSRVLGSLNQHWQPCRVHRPAPVQERLQDATDYLEGSAVPTSSRQVFQLVDHLEHSMQGCPSGQQQLLIERVILLTLLLWETPLRGNDIGKVSLTDFFLHDGQPVQTLTRQLQGLSSTAATGFQLTLRPDGTTTVKCHRSGPFTLTVTQDRQHCFLARLFSFIQHRFVAGQMASTYLLSSLTANHRSFADVPMRATSIGHRLNKHLEPAKMYAVESNQGLRCGQNQNLVVAGISTPQIGEAEQINCQCFRETC